MSTRTLVLGAIRGYRYEQVAPFVESLRAAGHAGDTVFLDFGGLDAPTRRALAAAEVRLWRPAPYLCDDALLHVTMARYAAARDFLQREGAAWDRVLLADVRDVFFQADPFAADTGGALACFLEEPGHTIESQPYNARWVRSCYGDEGLRKIGGFAISCSGATSGPRAAVGQYLEMMAAELSRLRARGRLDSGCDQAAHNWLLWHRLFPDVTIFANGRGNVLTLGIVPPAQVQPGADGLLRNHDGTLPAIVHQYDRHPPLVEAVAAKFPPRQIPDAPTELTQPVRAAPPERPRISVIVPTYDRPDRVSMLVERMRAQTAAPGDFELLLVDDGSPEPVLAGPAPFHVAVVRQPNAGPGAARNTGVRHARAPLVMFLNDDAVPAPDLIEKHLAAHAQAQQRVAVMGAFPFTQESLREPFTQALAGSDLLFDFPGLKPGELHGWTFFWTCNISLDKALLEAAGGFDEQFREAIVEDVELGYRLEKRGVRTLYLADAVCEHEHALTADSYARRSVRLGVNLARMWKKHGDPRILWQPPGTRIGHDLLMNLQAHVEARHFEGEEVLERLRRWSESARGKGPVPAADLARVAEAARRVSLTGYFRGVLLELTGSEPSQVMTKGVTRGKRTSIIVCSHDALQKTQNCLDSLRRTADPDFPTEIIFVDNGSTDGSAEWLAAQPDVALVRNAGNAGAPRARNQGLARATGEYLVFLDNDIVLTPGWLQRMIWHAEVDPLCACVAACADRASHGQEVAYEGPFDFDSVAGFALERGRKYHRHAKFAVAMASFCLLVKRSAVERLGGFDERFSPWGFEDDDYTTRAFFAGFHSRIALDVFVHHDTYTGPRLARHIELLKRNWKLFTQKWRLGDVPYEGKVDLLKAREQGWSAEELFVAFAA